jgi:hypothetical protein
MLALSSTVVLAIGAKPLEPFGKGSNALKAGTPDAGPEGPTALHLTCQKCQIRPSVQPPAGDERKPQIYAARRERQADRSLTAANAAALPALE